MDKSPEGGNAATKAFDLIIKGHGHKQEAQRHVEEENKCYEEALAFLSLAFAEDLARICDNIVGEAFGEEMAQNALLAAWKAMPKFRAPNDIDSLKPWLFKIALNLCRKELRTRRQAQHRSERTRAIKPKRQGSRRFNRYQHLKDVPAVELMRAIEQLDDEKDQFILKMDMAESFKTIKDLADALGMKDARVRQRIGRAIRRLNAILGL